jgi:hypothetical protein
MPTYDFDHDSSPDWGPLERIAALCATRSELSLLDADDFMYMARLVPLDVGPELHLYKHIHTRRYLNLDAGGHAYRWTGERIDHPDRRRRGPDTRIGGTSAVPATWCCPTWRAR